MSLKLRKFDMRRLRFDSVVVMLGKRNTGKSFLTKDILYNHRDIPLGTIVSPTESANEFFGELVPPFFIHDEYTPALIDRVVARQKKCVKLWKRDKRVDPRAFLVFDDCLYDNSWRNDKNVRLLFMNGRHWKMLFLITMQFPLGIPPNLRSNVDFVFILRENINSNRKRIYEHYAGIFPSFNEFCDVMDQCTSNYECLVIDNTTKSNKLEDQVFWYKADNHPRFRLGASVYWNIGKRYAARTRKKEDDDVHKRKLNLKVQKLV
jgi:hypothetical protein